MYSTNQTLSIDSKVNDLVKLTMTFILKIANLDFLAARNIRVSQS